MRDSIHIPVLLKETVRLLDPKKGKRYIDATLGLGGHSAELLSNEADVLAIEWDPKVLALAKERLARQFSKASCPGVSWQAVLGNFAQIEALARDNNFNPVDGVLFDLGISTWHLTKARRGFSFRDDQLDMRLNPKIETSAVELVNQLDQEELVQLFLSVQEKLARPIAQAIIKQRRVEPITKAHKLEKIINEVFSSRRGKRGKIRPATRVFLALRILVNQEEENLKEGLAGGLKVLKKGGRLAVISFHSGEDRIVKMTFRKWTKESKVDNLTKKPIIPGREEVIDNPSARSAVLRGVVKI